MEALTVVLAVLFTLFGIACLAVVILGVPGTWVLLGVAVAAELLDGVVLDRTGTVTFGWGLLALCAVLAGVGEAIEAGAGAVGARLGGASRRGMVGALVGGIVGALLLTPALPVPLLGTLVGALVGTFAGAWVGEATGPEHRSRSDNFRASFAAVLGSLAGRLGKLVPGVVVWVLLVRAAFV